VLNSRALLVPDWLPVHDTLVQFTEFLYTVSAYQNGELPLWNSYLYGGQPFYLLMNHGLLLNPIMWIWIIAGTFFELAYKDIFVYYHLTDVLFFAFGGMFFIRELTKDRYAGLIGFVILLFSGDSAYWANQIWDLTIIEYVPWVLYFGIRYFQGQTVFRGIVFAIFLGIAINVYMPVYMVTFAVILFIFLLIFYNRLVRGIDYRRLLRHALIAVPVIALMVLPTYLNYTEITHDNYQLGRFKGPEQITTYADRSEGGVIASRGDFEKILPGMFSLIYGWKEAIPLVGIMAFAFLILEVSSFSRKGMLWLSVLVFMVLSFLAWTTPYHFISFHLMPLYKLIRSYGFFSGFITLTAAVLASLGVQDLVEKMSSEGGDKAAFLKRHIALSALLGGLIFLIQPEDRGVAFIVATLFAGTPYLAAYLLKGPQADAVYRHMLLAAFLVIGVYNTAVIKGFDYHNAHGPVFSYSNAFSFSFQRPENYTEAHLPLLPGTPFLSSPGECCVTFYNIAEKVDGPWFFDVWGGAHTLFLDREYYQLSGIKSFDRLMKEKLHFFRYYTVGTIEETGGFEQSLEKSVLVIHDDNKVKYKGAKVDFYMQGNLEKGQRVLPHNLTLREKTANIVSFEVDIGEDAFMLYTDIYHKGFNAKVDGVNVSILKGMGNFKTIELPRGKHTVEFAFEPFYRYILISYLFVSGCFFIGMLSWWIFGTVRNIRLEIQKCRT